ncbi:MAG: DUF1700 domain-containing protein [Lachnospiraceae bacterium]|nr:DUF1700 domain-containing protein [Lachnospiraceae bacterium]
MNRAEFMSRLTALLQDVPPAEREEAIQYYNDYFDDAGEGNEASVIASLGSPEEIAKSIKAGLVDGGNGGEFTESGFQSYGQRDKNQIMSTNQSGSDGQNRGQNFQGGPYWQQGSTGNDTYGQQQYTGNNAGTQQGNGNRQPAKSMSGGKIALIVLLAILLSPVWIGILGGFLGGSAGLLAGLLGIFIGFLVVGVVLTVVGAALAVVGIAVVFSAPLGGLCLVGGGLIMVAVGLVFVWLMVLVVGTVVPALIRGFVNLCSRLFHRGGEQA